VPEGLRNCFLVPESALAEVCLVAELFLTAGACLVAELFLTAGVVGLPMTLEVGLRLSP